MRAVRYSFLVLFLAISSLEAATVAPRDLGLQCGTAINKLNPDDNAKVRDAFLTCLGSYVRIVTVNPPGDEDRGVDFLEAAFHEIGIPSWRFQADGRENLVATLTPSNAKQGRGRGEFYAWGNPTITREAPRLQVAPSIVLLNHIDVVEAFPKQWSRPELAYSGRVAAVPGRGGDAFLWGRGSLDRKGAAMLQLLSMALLKLERADIVRPIHFLALADGEQGSTGAKFAANEIRRGGALEALFEAEVLLGEGGFSLKEAMGQNTVLSVIGTEEKGGAWMRISHPDATSLMTDLAKLELAPRSTARMPRLFKNLGCHLVSATTPNARVNVSPSKVELRIACRELPAEADFRNAFLEGFEKTASIVAKRDGREMTVTVQTESSFIDHSDSALAIATLGLQRIGALKLAKYKKPPFFNYYLTEAQRELLNTIGKNHNFGWMPHLPNFQWWVQHMPFVESRALGRLGKKLGTDRLFRTSCTWTGLYISEDNDAEALVDCRLLPPEAMGLSASDRQGSQFASLVKDYLNDSRASVSLLEEWNATSSPMLHQAVLMMGEEISREDGRAAVTPFLYPGSSDVHYFRELGIPSYGFFPVELTLDLVASQRGANERFPVNEIIPSVSVYKRVLLRLVK